MAMPAARGLFHRAVAESGAALKHQRPEAASHAAAALLAELGVQQGEADKLQAIPAAQIIAAMGKLGPAGNFGPVVDGRSIPADPFDPAAPSVSANVPFLTGSNLTETTFFPNTPLGPLSDGELRGQVKAYVHTDDQGAEEILAAYRSANPAMDNTLLYQRISTDAWMRWQVQEQALRKAALGAAPAYVYHFEWMGPARDGKLHCPHGSEIPFVFGNLDAAPELTGTGPRREALSATISAAWAAFARTGDPNAPGLPHWPAFDAERRGTMVFDDVSRAVDDPRGAELRTLLVVRARSA